MEEQKEKLISVTVNGTVYKTSGNIIFGDDGDCNYFMAETALLENMDKAIQDGILGNGMRALMNKIHGK
jgi:predicted heme/steroid binding protein